MFVSLQGSSLCMRQFSARRLDGTCGLQGSSIVSIERGFIDSCVVNGAWGGLVLCFHSATLPQTWKYVHRPLLEDSFPFCSLIGMAGLDFKLSSGCHRDGNGPHLLGETENPQNMQWLDNGAITCQKMPHASRPAGGGGFPLCLRTAASKDHMASPN